jgi:hypothetical protein
MIHGLDAFCMAKSPKPNLDETTLQIARRMLSTPPKPHDEMKLGKSGTKKRSLPDAPKNKPKKANRN